VTPAKTKSLDPSWLALVAIVLAVTAARLFGLSLAQVDLGVDEAQYWLWAQDPAWGYYSKPPMVAWLIGAAQSVCGPSEACIRSPATLAWAGTSLFVGAAARSLFGARVGVVAGLAALLAPGAIFSARIISTDAPLLLFWSAALLALVRLRAGGGMAWAVLLGTAVGLGLLSKYAMLYFIGGLVLAVVFDPATRRALLSRRGLVVLGIGLIVLMPNLVWNLGHGLATVRHTADNASGGGLTPGIVDPLAFAGAQVFIAGPVVFAGFLWAIWRGLKGQASVDERLLFLFSVPIFLGLTVVATLTRAHANWAASGLIAAFILGAALLVRAGRTGWLIGGFAFALAFQALTLWGDVNADRWVVAGETPYAPVLGWEVFADAIADHAEANGTVTVVAERRSEIAALAYYGRDRAMTAKAWPPVAGQPPQNHFQMARALTGRESGPVLAVSPCAGADRFAASFGRVVDLGPVSTPAGPIRQRTVYLFLLDEPRMPLAVPAPCPAR
jgi:4-amino-4-deoxy-L-arabinose transferase-like glycosyltransferase